MIDVQTYDGAAIPLGRFEDRRLERMRAILERAGRELMQGPK